MSRELCLNEISREAESCSNALTLRTQAKEEANGCNLPSHSPDLNSTAMLCD